MHQILQHYLALLNLDEHTFFRIAHQWAFQKMPDLRRDVIEYRVCGIVPLYVQRYCEHLNQAKESENAVQKV